MFVVVLARRTFIGCFQHHYETLEALFIFRSCNCLNYKLLILAKSSKFNKYLLSFFLDFLYTYCSRRRYISNTNVYICIRYCFKMNISCIHTKSERNRREKKMGYLEQFAKDRRSKGKTEVLTARIPESLYKNFKDYCDNLGLSMSQAVYLLVKREMTAIETETQDDESELYTNVYKVNDDDDKTNHSVVCSNTNVYKSTTKSTTLRFTTKRWQVNGELPCPICGEWASSSNFSRHAKQHGSNTHSIFTNETYLIKVNEMILERTKSLSLDTSNK